MPKALAATVEITAYTAGYESTGKYPGDPAYGITFSGAIARQWRTVAAGPAIPLGTRVFIPELADRPNGGIFVVEDRGGAISNAHIDIYMDRYEEARQWGRQHLEVIFLLNADFPGDIALAINRDRLNHWKDMAALAEWQGKQKHS